LSYPKGSVGLIAFQELPFALTSLVALKNMSKLRIFQKNVTETENLKQKREQYVSKYQLLIIHGNN
jgi:hypothetical protein